MFVCGHDGVIENIIDMCVCVCATYNEFDGGH
jgi:hypothetical protein